tara:strand:- start:1646 stop:2221 length:576 start_codon:yes stop_codon:yes gene_type:complete
MKLFTKQKEKKFLSMLLDDPYKFLGIKIDPLKIRKNLDHFLFLSEFDAVNTLFKLHEALKTRGKKGLDVETKKKIKEAKKKWALAVIENHDVRSINALNKISKKVWGSRISDVEYGELRAKITEVNQPIPFLPKEEVPTCVSIGEVTITVPKGCRVNISNVELGEFKIQGGGSVSIGRVTKSNFEDIVIQG